MKINSDFMEAMFVPFVFAIFSLIVMCWAKSQPKETRKVINNNAYHVEVRSPANNVLLFSRDVSNYSKYYFDTGVSVTYSNGYRRDIEGNARVFYVGHYDLCTLKHTE